MLLEKSFQSYFALFKWKRWQDQQAYARVDIAGVADGGELEPSIPSSSKESSKRQLLVYTILIYMILSSIILLHLAFSASFYNKIRNPLSSNAKPDSTIMFSPCGNTPSEARAAGCVFDIVAFSWLPPRCHDAELGEEFRQLKDWEYYLDRNRTRLVSLEMALTGEFTGLNTKFEHHLHHCTFLWKKMHRALLSGGGGKQAIDSVTAAYVHTEHCSKVLTTNREVALDVINSAFLVRYPDCGMA